MDIEAKPLVASAEMFQAPFRIVDRFDPFLGVLVSASKGVLEWGKPGIELYNT